MADQDKSFVYGSISDAEGNTYLTIKIGDQEWMAEDLRTKSFNSGLPINNIEDDDEWSMTTEPAYCMYQNNQDAIGVLYNYYVIEHFEEIAPVGWHIPSDDEWKELEAYIGMDATDIDALGWRGESEGDALKISQDSLQSWSVTDNTWGTDDYGFGAKGAGSRFFKGQFGVPGQRQAGFWWTNTASPKFAFFRHLDYKKSGIFRYNGSYNYGFSIRCIKDN